MTPSSALMKPSKELFDEPELIVPQVWTPEPFQTQGVKFLLEHAAGALFLDPGMRKTSITLAALKVLQKKKIMRRTLVLAPRRPCYLVWPKEIKKWLDFNHFRFEILHGPDKDEALRRDADIYITNYDGLEWLLGIEKAKTPAGRTRVSMDMRRWRRLEFDTMVVDELSKLKHTNTNRFKSLKLVLPTFARRWGLTGSPAANGLMGLFGQAYTLDQGRTFGPYITHYRMKYFVPGFDGYSWDLREGADKEIYDRLKPLALRMAAEDYLKLPQVVENDIVVDLPEKVMEIYKQLDEDMITKINDNVVVASNAAVASMKCRQVASGGLYLDSDVTKLLKLGKSDREWVNLHTAKVDALADLIDELQGEPLLIAYDFEHDLDRLREKFGQDIPYIGGGVSDKRAAELEALWNKGKLPYLFGHPQSIAHGLNLQERASHVCWHTLTWDYELYDQFIRRLLRSGNPASRIVIHRILARGTVDIDVKIALQTKKKGQGALFDALKQRTKKRRR